MALPAERAGARDRLHFADAETWTTLIEDVGPASILVVIDRMFGASLRDYVTPDDVWQETLLEAWRLREQHTWQGVRAFRRWLLEIARNRVLRLSERQGALKRGGGVRVSSLSAMTEGQDGGPPRYAGPARTTTPSQVARDREIATAMQNALGSLPDEVREVLALRLFEDLTVEETAARLELGRSAVRHRFRKGLELYRQHLSRAMGGDLWVE